MKQTFCLPIDLLSLMTCALAGLTLIVQTPALGSQALIPANPHGPASFVTVDKSRQVVSLWQRKSPLQTVWTAVCSTGSESGDKHLEGDQRTPEGVYFLERRMSGHLGRELYGNLAYTLNYPNPVDRIRGKTGYGIWLHGRGKELLPRDTKGCVAMDTQKLRELGPHLRLGQTPILIGTSCSSREPTRELEVTARQLESRLSSWVQAWESRSELFFSHYDPQSFSRSDSQSFTAFRSRKENLFERYPWIDVYVDQLQLIPGPGYWVTTFGQYFRSPCFESQGLKRLYWQQMDQEGWKIVGREWVPLDLDLKQAYLKQARSRIRVWLQRWRSAWEEADLTAYAALYDPKARQDGRSGRQAIQAHKEKIWAKEKPARVTLEDIRILPAAAGFRVEFQQHYQGRKGYSDIGLKALILEPAPGSMRIVRETWSPLASS